MANDSEAIPGGSHGGDTESTGGEWPPKHLLAEIESIGQPSSAAAIPGEAGSPAAPVAPAPSEVASADAQTAAVPPERSIAIKKWREAHAVERRTGAWWQDDAKRENYLELTYRAPAREEYRMEKALEGKSVRSYRWHVHSAPEHLESAERRDLRMHRDRQRTYRGKTAETTRPYTDLSWLTVEERAEHVRRLARERKQRQRAKMVVRDLALDQVMEALADLDLGDPSEWELLDD